MDKKKQQLKKSLLRVRFFGKIQDWILKSKNGYCVSFSWCIKGTEESTLGDHS